MAQNPIRMTETLQKGNNFNLQRMGFFHKLLHFFFGHGIFPRQTGKFSLKGKPVHIFSQHRIESPTFELIQQGKEGFDFHLLGAEINMYAFNHYFHLGCIVSQPNAINHDYFDIFIYKRNIFTLHYGYIWADCRILPFISSTTS